MSDDYQLTTDAYSNVGRENSLRNKKRLFPEFFTVASNLISAFMETLADSNSKSFEGEPDRHKVLRPLEVSNIVGSEIRDHLHVEYEIEPGNKLPTAHVQPRHKPVLDIDMPVWVKESTTEGHFHLIIDHEMPWRDYRRLLIVMKEVGILETGFVDAALSRKGSWIRTPWTKKHKQDAKEQVAIAIAEKELDFS